MQFEYQGLESFAPAIAAEAGDKQVTPTLFGGDTARQPIDYAGPPGTVPYLSYWQIYDNRFPRLVSRGRS